MWPPRWNIARTFPVNRRLAKHKGAFFSFHERLAFYSNKRQILSKCFLIRGDMVIGATMHVPWVFIVNGDGSLTRKIGILKWLFFGALGGGYGALSLYVIAFQWYVRLCYKGLKSTDTFFTKNAHASRLHLELDNPGMTTPSPSPYIARDFITSAIQVVQPVYPVVSFSHHPTCYHYRW